MDGCPGAKMFDFNDKDDKKDSGSTAKIQSQLQHWPIQLHLISPTAPYYENKDVLLVADCVAYAMGGFHNDYMKGKSIAIACPKLDIKQEVYLEKIKSWFEDAKINTLTVLIMQVPCCSGLLGLAKKALDESSRKVPLKGIVVSLRGDVISEEWVQ
tara:strand:- start:2023 stop:2490 length:468 start_codon:yes stop_codon:yes gene_type:complete